jgi:hypothetical protein
MNRTRAADPQVLGPGFHKRTRGALDQALDTIPLSMGDEDLPEEGSEYYPCEYEESEAAGEAPYWATWGF